MSLQKYNDLNRPKLNNSQRALLSKFIMELMPTTGEKRRYPSNSLHNIHTTLDAVFMKFAGFGVSEREVIDMFLKLNYGFRTIPEPWTHYSNVPTLGFDERIYKENLKMRNQYIRTPLQEHQFNISVSGKTVQEIRLSLKPISIFANEVKTEIPRREIKRTIRIFFGLSDDLEMEDVFPQTIIAKIKYP